MNRRKFFVGTVGLATISGTLPFAAKSDWDWADGYIDGIKAGKQENYSRKSWREYLPINQLCSNSAMLLQNGYWIDFSRENIMFEGSLVERVKAQSRIRKTTLSLGFINNDASKFDSRLESLRFSMCQSIYLQDEKDGFIKHTYADVNSMKDFKERTKAMTAYVNEHNTYLING